MAVCGIAAQVTEFKNHKHITKIKKSKIRISPCQFQTNGIKRQIKTANPFLRTKRGATAPTRRFIPRAGLICLKVPKCKINTSKTFKCLSRMYIDRFRPLMAPPPTAIGLPMMATNKLRGRRRATGRISPTARRRSLVNNGGSARRPHGKRARSPSARSSSAYADG